MCSSLRHICIREGQPATIDCRLPTVNADSVVLLGFGFQKDIRISNNNNNDNEFYSLTLRRDDEWMLLAVGNQVKAFRNWTTSNSDKVLRLNIPKEEVTANSNIPRIFKCVISSIQGNIGPCIKLNIIEKSTSILKETGRICGEPVLTNDQRIDEERYQILKIVFIVLGVLALLGILVGCIIGVVKHKKNYAKEKEQFKNDKNFHSVTEGFVNADAERHMLTPSAASYTIRQSNATGSEFNFSDIRFRNPAMQSSAIVPNNVNITTQENIPPATPRTNYYTSNDITFPNGQRGQISGEQLSNQQQITNQNTIDKQQPPLTHQQFRQFKSENNNEKSYAYYIPPGNDGLVDVNEQSPLEKNLTTGPRRSYQSAYKENAIRMSQLQGEPSSILNFTNTMEQ
ncbi:hypothetical protein SNEBB_002308 [Seison nebaliae]|nr:hypothetical protein SNEBB_002308 [Seison nebaliae]